MCASFAVCKPFALLAVATNILASRLLPDEDGLEQRVITTRHAKRDIEHIDARRNFATQNIFSPEAAGCSPLAPTTATRLR